jgi:hypothetical protein
MVSNSLRAQTTIEFLLLLSVVVLLILAAITTVNDLTKTQQNATQQVRSGVENASLSLLQQFAEQRVGLQLTNVTEIKSNLVRLEVVKNDPYFSNQPAVLQAVAWNDYSGVMYVPEIRIRIDGPDGTQVLASPTSEFNVTVTLARAITVSFVPTAIGNYNVTLSSFDESGALQKQTKVPFTVIGGGVGGASFDIEKHIVVNRSGTIPSHYVEILQLPNSTVRSASLEMLDMRQYVDRNISFYVYDDVFKWVTGPADSPTSTSYKVTNSPYIAQIPDDAVITDALLQLDSANLWMGWPSDENPYTSSTVPAGAALLRLLHPGENMMLLRADGAGGQTNRDVEGYARLFVEYYGPGERQAPASSMFHSIRVNGQSVPLGTIMDISPYLHAGENYLNFTYVNGTFTYRLRVTTG